MNKIHQDQIGLTLWDALQEGFDLAFDVLAVGEVFLHLFCGDVVFVFTEDVFVFFVFGVVGREPVG